ncbi:MAG: UDP-N-acetylmuramoyl-L-alanyl-D-glutamate--2,6-diaminopimelate ligase [Hyphomonas sp.]|uniref:UDP-N-acetylmuramoyl-L-alanyl-D-glutamate--2, 6-diaminopimelate ligase n=1 Tax=Hyphomonas sp. TaxID=87 RepID=UPI001830CB26|nr:UDP-N-acetylmuramoyl-L-alanyl-D-glutamate--2,6-diaminopimelate ligase [Hyphomonas sp.]MBA3069356.1 UDP-N-acetylmuramoyl-L-alanyl-D-glutamate--2,6-diaminopimelate ligase [Hyphomonas sp.]MBU3922308.1 UDP-N-acetylmuramoyl-L-alanyl-D-glutamate--2,6-diaminopimelate ligase [Alphaproteobacteria bacterium]MBU4063738.1 UDP-N-acetylmuramoyl-L-alanyl-D-glutamate--2,6-diaminopimelate ligase [Alphaproteobacteria bacterium]MBU4164301.1 UDP-N-acetylmuramoyl-L-alanyl-D-glutamate--2,6-diaminopimelate ligase 
MKLKDLFPLAGNGETEILGLTADSRKVQPGWLFAALKGAAHDGSRFAAQAIAQGAAAILSDGSADTGDTPHVVADEPRRALALAAKRFHGAQPATVVAITGTNGKSSTVDFARQIWSRAGFKAASMGTLGAIGPDGKIEVGHTTPDPVTIHQTLEALAGQGVTHCAMEASSHGLEQHRLDGVALSAVGFLNFTQDHLDYHGTMEEYLRSKLKLFRSLAPAGIPAIINADSPQRDDFEAAAKAAGLTVVSFGWKGEDLWIDELMPKATGQTLFLYWRDTEQKPVELPLIGEFQALNALAAAAICLSLGMDFPAVADGLAHLKPVKGRLEFVGKTAAGAAVFVDYAHTPDGLDVLLRAVRPHTAGRLKVIFGCGGDRDARKRPVMGEIATRQADDVIVTDDNPRSEDPAKIRAAILGGAKGAREIGDRAEAIRTVIGELKKGDTLVIAGKGHETGQIIGNDILPFSDQEEALAAIRGGAA